MSIQFSNSSLSTGIVEQTRNLMRVDSNQYPTSRIVNSVNNWLDRIFTYGKRKDVNFQLDDSNHTKLPIGSTNIVANQSDYSFLTDEQGNRITNITRIDMVDANGNKTQLKKIDQKEVSGALGAYKTPAGVPVEYDLISDNVVRLYPTPAVNVTSGLIYYFQRSPSYFVAADTTKVPGVPDDLHRGFVIASAYDGALTLGLSNLQALSVELAKEESKLEEYFSSRNSDSLRRLVPSRENNK